MSISAKIREQLISSFRAELTEHVQTMTDGLLALEQSRPGSEPPSKSAEEQRRATLENVFRAAHSLKGAARAIGITAIEQLAHALEDLLDALRNDAIKPTPELFTTCYQALDAIQAVQTAYESGATTPPAQVIQALNALLSFRSGPKSTPDSMAFPIESLFSDIPPADPDVPFDAAEPTTLTPPTFDTHKEIVQAASRPPAIPPPLSPTGSDETVRVSVNKLDALMTQLGELTVAKIRIEQRLAQVRQSQQFMAQWQREWLSVRSAYGRLVRQDACSALGLQRLDPVEVQLATSGTESQDKYSSLSTDNIRDLLESSSGFSELGKDLAHLLHYIAASQELLRQVNVLMQDLARQCADDTMQLSLAIAKLEQEVKRVRMLPFGTITGPLGRMVRDLAREAGKEAALHIIGGDTELDRRVLEQIKDPLIHLLRNAIDHGIEPPEQRVALGKPRSGTVTLSVEQIGSNVVICVSDDGRGLDLEAIRQAIARQSDALDSPKSSIDAQALSEAELAEIIFKVGISTSTVVTDISGRGVGLDVVRRNVEALQGQVKVNWTPGEGTSFNLTLPLILTSMRGLLVQASDEQFAIPFNAIEHIMYVSPHEILRLKGHNAVRYSGRPVTLLRLGDLLELPRTAQGADGHILIIVVTDAERHLALAVDELIGEQEIVNKGLGKQLVRVGGIAGATLMGSGQVILILNIADLIKLAMQSSQHPILNASPKAEPLIAAQAQQHILIVDDSITTRTLEKNILEAAGYIVHLATNGQEALDIIATSGAPDLIVTDIVMPGMDGFELTQQIKSDAQTAGVPVILVTSLDSPEDKARGIEIGADAYIVKSSFDQSNLLETIQQLI